MHKKHISFILLSSAAALYSPCLQCSVLASVFLNTQSLPVSQTPAWPSTANNRAAVLNRFLHAKLASFAYTLQICDMVMQGDVTKSRN